MTKPQFPPLEDLPYNGRGYKPPDRRMLAAAVHLMKAAMGDGYPSDISSSALDIYVKSALEMAAEDEPRGASTWAIIDAVILGWFADLLAHGGGKEE
jgi:hypothetical protein